MRRIGRTLAVMLACLLVMVGLPTAAQAVAPAPPVAGLSAYSMVGSIYLSWTNPALASPLDTVVRAAEGFVAPALPTDGDPVPLNGPASAIADFLTPATPYSFSVFSHDSVDGYGPAVSITIRGSLISLSAAPASLTFGGKTRLSGRLIDPDGGVLFGEQVAVYARRHGAPFWNFLDSATTNASGIFTLLAQPPVNADFQVYFYGSADSSHIGSTAGPISVNVAPSVGISVNRGSAPLGTTFTIKTGVAPRHAGQLVRLQRFYGGAWHTVATRRLSSTSAATFPVRPATRGVYKYRVVKPADADHIAGTSRSVFVRAS